MNHTTNEKIEELESISHLPKAILIVRDRIKNLYF